MHKAWIWSSVVIAAAMLAACGGDDAGGNGAGGNGGGEAAADPMATPRGSIEHQFGLLKAKDADALRACFTPRLQDRITPDVVAKGAEEAGGYSMEELYASAEEGEHDGKRTTKVKMKNGRTLTTLVLVDGKWLADTIWFR